MKSGVKVLLMGLGFLACLLIFNEISHQTETQNLNIQAAYVDLRNANFEKNYRLNGEWEFYWKERPETINPITSQKKIVEIPNYWNEWTGEGQGYGTFRITIRTPNDWDTPLAIESLEQDTSHAIYINGKKYASSGKPGKSSSETIAQVKTTLAVLPTSSNQTFTIDLFIANFSHRKGGPWNPITLGTYQNIQAEANVRKLKETTIAAILGFISLFFSVFLFSKQSEIRISGIVFFSGAVFLRTISTGERVLSDFFPIPYWLMLRIEYFSWFWVVPALYYYFQSVFPKDFSKKIGFYFYGLSLLLSLSLFLPSTWFTYVGIFYPIVFLSNSIFMMVYLTRSFLKKRKHSENLIFGIVLLFVGATNDTLHAMGIIHTSYIASPLVIFFVALQVLTFAKSFQTILEQEKALKETLNRIGESYARFVPKEFLRFLGKQEITEIELGEQVQKKMAILFADIRSFTEFSETLSPKENFEFLNSYLKRVGPIIRKNGGFIDKFIGDAIMALFPDDSNQAIKAAVEMQEEIRKYNEHRKKVGYQEIQVGIGIHTGLLILGTIGEHERMEGTVISDAVNLASRIEGLTKFFNSPVILSADTFIEADTSLGFEYRLLDRMPVKGKSENVFIVEVIDAYEPVRRQKILDYKEAYVLALDSYRRGDFEEAETLFGSILQAIPEDTVCLRFKEKARQGILHKIDKALEAQDSFSQWN